MMDVNILANTNIKINDKPGWVSNPYAQKPDGFNAIFENVNKFYKSNESDFAKTSEMEKEINIEQDKIKFETREEKKEEIQIKSKEEKTDAEDTELKNEENKEKNTDKKTEEETIIEGVISKAVETLTAIENPAKDILTIVAEKIAQIRAAKNDSSKDGKTDLENAKKELPKIEEVNLKVITQDSKTKVQPQTQQVLLNLNNETIEAKPNLANQNTTAVDDLKTKTPVIQSTVVQDTEVKDLKLKKSIKELLEQSNLSQELLDKTNARVVSVETTTSNSNNLLNNQNAQEQGVKISLDHNGVLNNLEAGKNINFSKTIDNVQQPKEINKSDILTQIHTKLENLKEEGTTKVTIVLKPENLGKINLELINSKEGLIARMTAENTNVKEILEKNLDSLKGSLGSQGLSVSSVVVDVAESKNASNEMFSFEQGQSSQDFREEISKKTFEQSNETFSAESNDSTIEDTGLREDQTLSASHIGEIDYKI